MHFKIYTKYLSVCKIMFLVAKQNSLNINMGNFAPMEQVLYKFKISKAFGVTLNTSFKKSKFIAYIYISVGLH